MGPSHATESVELSYPAVDNNNKKILFPKHQPVLPESCTLKMGSQHSKLAESGLGYRLAVRMLAWRGACPCDLYAQ